jgi:hypothetical protein
MTAHLTRLDVTRVDRMPLLLLPPSTISGFRAASTIYWPSSSVASKMI